MFNDAITEINKINDLYTQLLANSTEVDVLTDRINKLEKDPNCNIDDLERLYSREFYLYIEHIGIYDDLIRAIDNEPKTFENKFELARIKRDAHNMLRVTYVDI